MYPTAGYEGVRHAISCLGASLGYCCRRERRNDIPVPERPSSLGRAWEMGLCGNRLQHSLRCKEPRGQPWSENLGATTTP